MNNSKEIVINGRENVYKLSRIDSSIAVRIKYRDRNQWIFDENFESFDKAMAYINQCLAYESHGLAWTFGVNRFGQCEID